MTRSTATVLAAVISLIAGFLMISNESVWIDEVQTVRFAAQPSAGALFEEIARSGKSEAQMPLGLLSAWAGAQVLGLSEWQLRAANLPWIALTGVAAMLIGRLYQRKSFLWMVLLAPFLWYYANEARPYAVQICAGTWLLYFLIRLSTAPELQTSAVIGLGTVAVLGFGTHALFGFVVFGVGLAAIPALFSRRATLRKEHIFAAAIAFLVLVGTAAYYAWTVKRGAAGARLWNVGVANLAFSGYELLGFGGLGPPRSEIRDLARNGQQLFHSFAKPQNISVLVLAAVYALALCRAMRLWKDRTLLAAVAAFVISSCSLFAAASLMRFPFWGRHLAGLLPFILYATWRIIDRGFGPLSRPVVLGLLLVCFTASSLRQRFSPEYGKDDYRSAVAFAASALGRGQVVWWSADPEVAGYYHLPATTNQQPSNAVLIVINQDPSKINELAKPAVIVTSKPDIHDNGGAVKDYLANERFIEAGRANGFIFWRRADSKL